MNIAREAENYIRQYFKTEKKIKLVKPDKEEIGFDFRNEDSEIIIEVKGSSKSKLSDVMFSMFTNAEYEKAKECIRKKLIYEVHIVLGVGTITIKHYCIPARTFIEKVKTRSNMIFTDNKRIRKI